MRRFAMLLITTLVLAAATAWAQAPSTMPLQLNLTSDDGSAVTGTVVVTFSIFDSEAVGTGALLWGPETHTVTTSDGVISVLLGAGDTPVPLEAVIFDGSVRFLSVVVDGGPEMDPRLPIGSSAYAYSADRATSYVTRFLYDDPVSQIPDTAGGTYALMYTVGTFEKRRDDTELRVSWQSNVRNGSTGNGFCEFQLRIDGVSDNGSTGNTYEQGRIAAVVYALDQYVQHSNTFTGVPAGTHTVEIWLRGLRTSNCILNQGFFTDELVVEEILPTQYQLIDTTNKRAEEGVGGVETGRFE